VTACSTTSLEGDDNDISVSVTNAASTERSISSPALLQTRVQMTVHAHCSQQVCQAKLSLCGESARFSKFFTKRFSIRESKVVTKRLFNGEPFCRYQVSSERFPMVVTLRHLLQVAL